MREVIGCFAAGLDPRSWRSWYMWGQRSRGFPMDDEALFQLLVELMEKLSIKVVCKNLHDEEFKISGGLCKVRGRNLMIMDKRSPLKSRITLLARELKEFNLEDQYIPPVLRELLEESR